MRQQRQRQFLRQWTVYAMVDGVLVTVERVQGSAPRDVGTAMRVFEEGQEGTIGGGALEWQAAALAREMLQTGEMRKRQVVPLGPDLGQCCGGTVTLVFGRDARVSEFTQPPLWIWGAGHVGRAIAGVVAPFADRAITVVDTTADRMPQDLPSNVTPLLAADPVRVVGHAPDEADHLIVTYSHEIDLSLCDAVLRRGFGSIGLIGSSTKWARFRRRLHAMGHEVDHIARIACPIGDPSLGKHPQAIALGVAAAMLARETNARGERAG